MKMKKILVMTISIILLITGLIILIISDSEMSKVLETREETGEYDREGWEKYRAYGGIGGSICYIGIFIFIFAIIVPYYWEKKQPQQNTQQTKSLIKQSNQRRYCPECNKQIPLDSKFCPYCGMSNP